MRSCWIASVVVLAACGASTRDLHRDTLASITAASADAHALERMMSGAVVNTGLWFHDPACTKQFPSAGEVHEAEFGAFAKCLAGLHLQPSKRHGMTPDTAVLTYAPGIEIEARVLDRYQGPVLLAIGYVGRVRMGDGLPTISREAFESLRTAGEPDGPLDARVSAALMSERESQPDHVDPYAWLKICVDAEGSVTSTHAREASSFAAAEAFAAAARAWRFRPFVADGQAIPVCAVVLLAIPPDHGDVDLAPFPRATDLGPTDPLFVGGRVMTSRRVSGKTAITPEEPTRRAIARAGIRTVIGAFTFCIDETGKVIQVETDQPTGIPGYDQLLVAGIRRWRYQPYLRDGAAIPVCSGATFFYTQN